MIAEGLKTKGPLKATDVVTHVNQQRFFKQNTILINLQNRNFFERMVDGRYRVRNHRGVFDGDSSAFVIFHFTVDNRYMGTSYWASSKVS